MLFICYPKCSTCQKAQRWLDAKGVAYELRNIKEQKPTADELRAWYKMSGLPLKKFFNTSGLIYKDLGLKDKLPAYMIPNRYEVLAEMPINLNGKIDRTLLKQQYIKEN